MDIERCSMDVPFVRCDIQPRLRIGRKGPAPEASMDDTILWGRKTMSESASRGGAGGLGSAIKKYVFSRNPPAEPVRGVEFVREPIPQFAERLRAEPGRDIWRWEAPESSVRFPTFIGEGIPLIGARSPDHRPVAAAGSPHHLWKGRGQCSHWHNERVWGWCGS